MPDPAAKDSAAKAPAPSSGQYESCPLSSHNIVIERGPRRQDSWTDAQPRDFEDSLTDAQYQDTVQVEPIVVEDESLQPHVARLEPALPRMALPVDQFSQNDPTSQAARADDLLDALGAVRVPADRQNDVADTLINALAQASNE